MDDRNPRVSAGTVVAGKYRVERTLAESRMAVVVLATHLQLKRSVVLKFLSGEVTAAPNVVAHFTSEANAIAKLRSEHVAHVFDAGTTDDGTPYVVTEYLEGQSLARALQLRGRLDVPTAVEHVIDACEGLAEAHARGIAHRDVNPHNLFLIERPGWYAIKIVAFGLRSAPPVDPRTDIWSLGAILHELLAGKPAFDTSQAKAELLETIPDRSPPELHVLRADVPERLAAIVTRCLARDPESFFASTGELAMALLPFAPPRARVVAERASLMKPAFPVPSESTASPPAGPIVEQRADEQAPLAGDHEPGEPAANKGGDPASELGHEPPSPEPTWDPDALAAASRFPSRARTWLAVAMLAGAAMLVSLTIIFVGAPDRRSKPVALSAEIPAAKAPEVAPALSASQVPLPTVKPELVEVVVNALPESAQISVDGTAVTGNPFRSLYAKDTKTHRITVFAGGYQSKSEDVTFARNVVVDLNLDTDLDANPNRRIPAPVAVPQHQTSLASPDRRTKQPSSDRAMAPASGPPQTPIASTGGEVGPAGGRRPRLPIERSDPYDATGARRGRIETTDPYRGP